MPKIGDPNMSKFNTGHFGFSAAKIDDLGASEYTLVAIAADRSGSTAGFQKGMENVLKEIIKACKHSPRAENLLLRYVAFNQHIDEKMGFSMLKDCEPDNFDNTLIAGGGTALYAATLDALEAVDVYGKELNKKDFDANAIVFIITDGDNTAAGATVQQVHDTLKSVVNSEHLESIMTILIGVNLNEPHMAQCLSDFEQKVGFTQFVSLDNANKSTLAKLANFVSKSILSQSQHLGSGGPSQPITF